MIKAILTKPLDGMPEGTEREFDKVDFDRLRELGAVREASGLREDGPTVTEYVAAGYPASRYPPEGFAPRSTADEVATAIADAEREAAAKAAVAVPAETEGGSTAAKAAPPVENKMAPEVSNKEPSTADIRRRSR